MIQDMKMGEAEWRDVLHLVVPVSYCQFTTLDSRWVEFIKQTGLTYPECRKRRYKIGSTSGYLPGMLAINQADAEKQGYVPDATFGAGDVPRGRPYPHMVLRNILELDVSPVQSVVKVDDTLTGIEEGLNAGCWAVGLAISGNEVGVQLDEWEAFPDDIRQKHRDRIYPTMYQRGAHYVVDSIADLVPCLERHRKPHEAWRETLRANTQRRAL